MQAPFISKVQGTLDVSGPHVSLMSSEVRLFNGLPLIGVACSWLSASSTFLYAYVAAGWLASAPQSRMACSTCTAILARACRSSSVNEGCWGVLFACDGATVDTEGDADEDGFSRVAVLRITPTMMAVKAMIAMTAEVFFPLPIHVIPWRGEQCV